MSGNITKHVYDLDVNAAAYAAAMVEAITAAEKLDEAITTLPAEVDIDVSVQDADLSSLEALDEAVFEPEIAPDLDEAPIAEVEDLDSTSVEPGIDPDLDESPISAVEDLDSASVEPEINPRETQQGKEIIDRLDNLITLQAIDLAINIAGTAMDFLRRIEAFTLTPLLDAGDAVARINAQTANAIPNARELVTDILYDNLGDSLDQITAVAIAAHQIGAPVEDAARAALLFTRTFTDQDPLAVLGVMNRMVSGGLVPSFGDAADLMTTFFQQGGNQAGDALSAIDQFGQSWVDMGLTGEQALSILKSGLDANMASATDGARALQALDDSLTAAARNANSPQAQALESLGIENPKQSGETIGAEFIDGLIEAINAAPATDQDSVITALFGKGGKKFTGAITELSTEALGPFEDIVGAAETAADAIKDSLRGAIDEFNLMVQEAANDFLSSDQIDLPGKIEAIKQGIQTAIEVLQGGGSLGEALDIGLHIEGVDTFIDNFQRVVGNLEIIFLQVAAAVADALGHDSRGILAEVARLSEGQLAFDLKIANTSEIEGIIQTAIGRGVSGEGIASGLRASIDELLAEGQVGRAQDLLEALGQLPGAVVEVRSALGVLEERVEIPIDPSMTPEEFQAYVDEIVASKGRADLTVTADVFEIDVAGLSSSVSEAVQAVNDAWTAAINSGDFAGAAEIARELDDPSLYRATFDQAIAANKLGVAESMADVLADPLLIASVEEAAAPLRAAFETAIAEGDFDFAQAVADTLGDSDLSQVVSDLREGVQTASGDIISAAGDAAEAVAQMDQSIASDLTGNTVTSSFEAVAMSAEENFPVVIRWLDDVIAKVTELDRQALALDRVAAKFTALSNAVGEFPTSMMQDIVNAATGFAGAQAVVNNSTVNNNVNITNNPSNNAQVQADQYNIGRTLG